MDCAEFQRRLGADPNALDAGMRAHASGCADCTRALAQAQAFERRLADAFAVPVPADLAARVLAASRIDAEPASRADAKSMRDAATQADVRPLRAARPRRRQGAWLALAAAAVLVVALGLTHWRANANSLPALAIAHVVAPDERDALDLKTPLPRADVEATFAARGVHLVAAPPIDVVYAAKCGLGGTPIVHMVMPETGGPVSVMYVPGARERASESLRRDDLVARAVPMDRGVLVMVAREDRTFGAIENAWRNAIEGPQAAAIGEQ
jgi:hypothetical protein